MHYILSDAKGGSGFYRGHDSNVAKVHLNPLVNDLRGDRDNRQDLESSSWKTLEANANANVLEALVTPPIRDEEVDIIICVHNALADVRRCIDSIIANTLRPYRLILIDDGSGHDTNCYLSDVNNAYHSILIQE